MTNNVLIYTISAGPSPKSFLYTGYLFLQSVLISLDRPEILKSIAEQYRIHYSFYEVISRRIYNRVLDPASKPGAYERKYNYVERPDFKPNDVTVPWIC